MKPNRLTEKARNAKRESKTIEFKERFDITSPGEWVEMVKDIVALANSGGGAVLFGVKNNGGASDFDAAPILGMDPAIITDKIAKYTGEQYSDFSMEELPREGHKVAVLLISATSVPIAFDREGDYRTEQGEQKFGFRKGTLYFRHGAKSEPATTNDLRNFIEQELNRIRRDWMGGIRKVVEAPEGSQIQVVSSKTLGTTPTVRLTEAKEAIPVRKLDPDKTHPYRLKETLESLNKRFAGAVKVNSYDVQCVRKVHEIDKKPQYFHAPKFGSPQYSDAFADWLVDQHGRDSAFFEKCREKAKER